MLLSNSASEDFHVGEVICYAAHIMCILGWLRLSGDDSMH